MEFRMSLLSNGSVFVEVSDDSLITAKTMASKTFATSVGEIFIQANQFGLSHLTLSDSRQAVSENTEFNRQAHDHLVAAELQLEEYFCGQRQYFSLVLAPKGTQFQKDVWQALLALDYGCTCSYADLANTINRPKAVRAVGAANGANSIAIIIPCHRVIGKNGSLTGYAYGLEMKKSLLSLEGVNGFSLS
ncbi:methylated-DNA--[protein]-cysteine S-methyltransferase [Shewanella eurypsychrophilus]|uniref:Methylated-DNA--protein-cysteine methyltransferase n=2 Tax=Shewanellaceae TaxID=267890 RepID=A0ABX6VD81_9GAMM|nr:methylated-DNA--[protein]-cysteine S-methyltransferase [Shewanella sp. YLB-09]QPG60494.1 methylated-DNA--[protein]-cysteine S-methyltransferase [Shewanella eurypsychrophilus]